MHAQGFETFEQPIEIFMPVYEGSLDNWIQQHKDQGQEAIKETVGTVLYQILLALDHIHTHEPQIIYRDIKPTNILFQGNDFFLTDFGIAKAVDMSRTIARSPSYMAPEVWISGNQTPKVDIYALGATVVVCLQESLPETEPQVT
jgi:serine/threonine protein kinase